MGDVSIVTNEHNLFTRCQLQIPTGFVADRPKIYAFELCVFPDGFCPVLLTIRRL